MGMGTGYALVQRCSAAGGRLLVLHWRVLGVRWSINNIYDPHHHHSSVHISHLTPHILIIVIHTSYKPAVPLPTPQSMHAKTARTENARALVVVSIYPHHTYPTAYPSAYLPPHPQMGTPHPPLNGRATPTPHPQPPFRQKQNQQEQEQKPVGSKVKKKKPDAARQAALSSTKKKRQHAIKMKNNPTP